MMIFVNDLFTMAYSCWKYILNVNTSNLPLVHPLVKGPKFQTPKKTTPGNFANLVDWAFLISLWYVQILFAYVINAYIFVYTHIIYNI